MPANIQLNAALETTRQIPLTTAEPLAERCAVCVVIPVRNEAALLPNALRRLTYQYDLFHQPFAHERYEIVLLANNCTDDSACIARRHAREHPTLRLHVVEYDFPRREAHVGTARRTLMNEAYRRLTSRGRAARGIIASTDGDTLVSRTWIAATIAEIDSGVDAIGGRIYLCHDARQSLPENTFRTYEQNERYRLLAARLVGLLDPLAHDPAPHHQHFGASLAVTAEAYHRAGGMPAVPFLEDVAFYDCLQFIDARFRHSQQVHVETSARMVGRVPIGLSQQLGEWSKMNHEGEQPQVASVAQIERRARLRQRLRALWLKNRGAARQDINYAADKLACDAGVESRWLCDRLRMSLSFGDLAAQFEQHSAVPNIGVMVADVKSVISELQARITALRDRRGIRHTPHNLSAKSLEEINPVSLGSFVDEMSQGAF